MEGDLRNGAENGDSVEDVGEGALEDDLSIGGGEDRDGRFLAHVEGTDVVEAEDVVGVGVGEDQSVEALEAGAKGLEAEVGRGVNDHVAAGMREQDGGAGAVVAWVGGAANAALAAKRGNAHRSAGAENGEAERVCGCGRGGHGGQALPLAFSFMA